MEMMEVKQFYVVAVFTIIAVAVVMFVYVERMRKFFIDQRKDIHAYAGELERALAQMWFAYVNKDEEHPHDYELEALQRAEELLGPWEECMPELLKERKDHE